MKRLIAVGLLTGLLGGSFAAPSTASSIARPKPKTVKTTLYAHGPSQLGEIDVVGSQLPEPCSADLPLTLTPTEPDAAIDRSMALRPISKDDQEIISPTFQGTVSGTIKGDVIVTAKVLTALGANLEAKIWVDSECPSSSKPTKRVAALVDAGETDASFTFEDLDLRIKSSIAIQIAASTALNRSAGRLLYDSVDALTRVEFRCIPPKGKRQCA